MNKKSKYQLLKELRLLKNKLRILESKPRKPFLTIKEAEKIIRKVPTSIFKDKRGVEHFVCRITLPSCYAYKRVKVIVYKRSKNGNK